jgi:hypothetical protein
MKPDPFESILRALARATGPERAITLADLATAAGVSRREAEATIQERLADFPWPLVSGSVGVYQPTDPDDLNRYLSSLHRRHRAMQAREATVRRKARAAGWREEAGRFAHPPAQLELFA